MIIIVESKQAGHVAFVGTATHLHVAQVTPVVLPFQLDVHDVVLLLHVVSDEFTLLGRFVIDLDILHGEVRQVVEHHPVLPLEEVLAVECQVVHLLAVDIDVAVVLQLRTRHLPDESVKHGTFGQVEGRSIIDDGIAPVGYLHSRTLHHDTFQLTLSPDVVLFLLHEQSRQFKAVVACQVA